MSDEHEHLYASLNTEQAVIYDMVINAVTNKQGGFFFIYGAGGTGKTFLYKTILARLRSIGLIALAVASSGNTNQHTFPIIPIASYVSHIYKRNLLTIVPCYTGIASLLLPGGRTAHSRFAIPLELLQNSTCSIKQNTQLAHLLQKVSLIIWDEAPMMQKYAFEAVDKTLRDILGFQDYVNRERPFGGMPVLLGGDFRQILPVITKGRREDVVQACINRSTLWKTCHLFTLHRSMRVSEYTSSGLLDIEKQRFNKWLLDIGDGIVPATSREGEDEATWIEIPQRFIVEDCGTPVTSIVKAVFPQFGEIELDDDFLCERAILTPRNVDAGEINDYMLGQLKTPAKSYKSSDEICRASTDILEQEQLYPTEFLNSLNFPGSTLPHPPTPISVTLM